MILPRGIEIKQPEVWKPITTKEVDNVAPIYTISNYGITYNSRTNTYLPQNIFYRKDKYITISLALQNGDHVYAQPHRLVMMVFDPIENYKEYDVNHKDGIKYHNWLWNLEWSTHLDNMRHAMENNLFKHGSERGNSVYDEELIREICKYISEGLSPKQVNQKLNGDYTKLYHNIKNGHSWIFISKDYDFSNAYSRLVFDSTKREKIEYIVKTNPNITREEILTILGYTKDNCKWYDVLAALNRFLDKLSS